MKTEAHRLKTDRAPGSRNRASHKTEGNRVKHDRLVAAPAALPKKRKKKKKQDESDAADAE